MGSMAIRLRKRLGVRRGQATIEMAMSFPVMFVIIMAVVELGFAFNAYTSVVAAAGHGARAGAVYVFNGSFSASANNDNRERGEGAMTPAYTYVDNVRSTVARSLGTLRSGLTY